MKDDIKTIFYFVNNMDKDVYERKVRSEEINPRTIVFSKNNKSIFAQGTQYGTVGIEDLKAMLESLFKGDNVILPIASKTNRGVIKVGEGFKMSGSDLDELSIDFESSIWGTNISNWIKNLFLSDTTLRATKNSYGIVKIGTGLNIKDGVVSVDFSDIPSDSKALASTENYGVVKIKTDGGIIVQDGIISIDPTKLGSGKTGQDGIDGKDGKDGRGIVSVTKTGSTGTNPVVDTYTITYTEGSPTQFFVTNGKDGTGGGNTDPSNNGTGKYYQQAFKTMFTNDTPSLPPTNWTDGAGGWYKSADNQDGTKHIWMTTRLVDLNDSPIEEWQGPWKITGPEGRPGEDGKGIEFIYTRTNSSDIPARPSNVGTVNGEPVTYNNTLDDFIPTGWYDNPTGVEPNMQYEWACVRTSDREGKWSDFSNPFLWSHWGQNGIDGDGVEYIFHANTNGVPTTDPSEWEIVDEAEYILPAQKNVIWFDDPVDLETLGPGAKEWVCIRKKRNGHWGAFSAPALWARFAADGVAVGYTVDLTNPTIPVSLNADGSSGTGYIQATCGVQVFQNGNPVNNFTVSTDYAKISGHSVQNNSNSSSNYLQISTDQSAKQIYISMRNLQNFSNKVITIPVSVVIDGVEVKRSINIVGVSVGVVGATVDLWTSAKAIRTNYAQTRCVPSDLEVGLKITTMEGNTPNTQLYKYSQIPSQYGGLFTFKYYYSDEVNTNNAITINNGTITNLSAAKESIIVLMLYNGYIIDSDEIPYVHDGAPFVGDGPIVYSIDVESSSLRVHQDANNDWVYSGGVGFTVSKKVNEIASSGQTSTHTYKMGYDTDHYTFIDGSSSGYDNETLVINIGGQAVTGTYANNKWTAQVATDTTYVDGTTPAFANIQVLNATNTVVASVVVPFTIDGAKGSSAQALDQPIFRFLSWEELKTNYAADNTNNPTLEDGTTPDGNGITYLDIIYTNDGHYYRVKERKTFSQVITTNDNVISMNSNMFWEFTNLGNAMFQTILARNAFIQNLNSRELVITDGNSNPVAGITSGTAVAGDGGESLTAQERGSVRIWAGSPTKEVGGVTTTNLTNCPFYVTNTGEMHAENGVFSGIVKANTFYNKWQHPNSGTAINPSDGTSVIIPGTGTSSGNITLPSATTYDGMVITAAYFLTAFTRTYVAPCTIVPPNGQYIYINEDLGNQDYITAIDSISVVPNKIYRFHAVRESSYSNGYWLLEGDLTGCTITYNNGSSHTF